MPRRKVLSIITNSIVLRNGILMCDLTVNCEGYYAIQGYLGLQHTTDPYGGGRYAGDRYVRVGPPAEWLGGDFLLAYRNGDLGESDFHALTEEVNRQVRKPALGARAPSKTSWERLLEEEGF